MQDALGTVSAETIDSRSVEELQGLGMTFRKAEYIKDFCHKVLSGEFNLDAVERMSDEEAIRALSSLKGIGVWTAEMILLFCLFSPCGSVASLYLWAVASGRYAEYKDYQKK